MVAIGFIVVVGVLAVVIGTRRTVVRGDVMADDLRRLLEQRGTPVDRLDCDDEIPIGHDGARFVCTMYQGEVAVDVEYTLTRDGALVGGRFAGPGHAASHP